MNILSRLALIAFLLPAAAAFAGQEGAGPAVASVPVLKTQQAPANAIPAAWWGRYGWEWDIIPAGTRVRLCGTFEQKTAMYRNQGDAEPVLFLPKNEAGEFAGQHKNGWVQVRTAQGTYWTDYRDVEPDFSTASKR